MSRKNPFMRISIGSDLFQTGDGKLFGCSVTSGEGESMSNCSFRVRASRSLVDKYFATIYKNDGLDPVVIPSQGSDGESNGTSSSYSGSVPSLNGVDPAKIKRAVNFYLGKGMSLEGAAYLVGNYIQESSLNHLANNGLGNIGLAQWDASRRATNGGIPLGTNDFVKQMEWAIAEMVTDSVNSGENHNVREKLNGTNISAITHALSRWERYGGNEEGGRYAYGAQLLEALKKGGSSSKASDSVASTQQPKAIEKVSTAAFTGSQITVELGFNGTPLIAMSFLHTSIDYDHISRTLTFGGSAATWVLTQRVKSTAFRDCSLEQIAQQICDAHGLTLDYKGEKIEYEYFPQLGISDYETLLLECRRIGYRMHCDGAILSIAPRFARSKSKDSAIAADNGLSDFVLEYGDNLTTFKVSHSAGGDSGGARSSSPSERSSTGETKFEIDPSTGAIAQVRKEDPTGGTTGYHTSTIKPKTKGGTDEADKVRRENALRVRGIVAQFSCPCENGSLLLTPDSIFRTTQISEFIDRVWTVESVTHDWAEGSGFITSGTVYSPMKNKYPTPETSSASGGSSGTQGDPSSLTNPGGFIHPTAGRGRLTSPYGQRGGRLHAGVDVAPNPEDPFNIPIYASAGGTVDIQNVAGGYGLNILIDHGNGFWTLYGHLSETLVSDGAIVKQGDNIAKMGFSGRVIPAGEGGTHLHFNIYKGSPSEGSTVNPEDYIKFR
jgi:phage protein D